MEEELIHCECLQRHIHEVARVDLWFADSEGSYWIEIYIGTERIFQSVGYAVRELAEVEHERSCRNLVRIIETWLAQQGL